MSRAVGSCALLSPFDSRTFPRDLLCWSSSQQTEVHALLHSLYADWLADWGLIARELGSAEVPYLSDKGARHTLQEQLCGVKIPGAPTSAPISTPSISELLAEDAWNDWIGRLTDLLSEPSDVTAAGAPDFLTGTGLTSSGPWSGAIDVVFPWWAGHWQLRLDAATVRPLLKKISPSAHVQPFGLQGGLVSLTQALVNQPLQVSAEFPPVFLTLGQIDSLRIGDVIPLHLPVDKPTHLQLQAGAKQAVCHAWLGQRNGRMAAELSILPVSP